MEDEALANQTGELRPSDPEETGKDIPQIQVTLAATEDVSLEALVKRYEAERKRKGKQEAKPRKKKPRLASKAVVINEPAPETIRVSFAPLDKEEERQKESKEEKENPQKEEGVYEKMEVLVTGRLLDAMVHFEDPQQNRECEGRVLNGKVAKTGKSLCLSELRDLGAEEKFISYFKSIRFEWFLDHSAEEVPVALTKEFFTSFKLKATTDPDADSITFHLFNEEMVMSIREWSLRIGLFTPEEDEEGAWTREKLAHPRKQKVS